MNIKPALKYHIMTTIKPLIIYYGIIFALHILVIESYYKFGHSSNMTFGGFESASMIFIFIVGIASFRDTYKFFLQNGISRKTMFLTLCIFIVSIATFMALIDDINAVMTSSFINYESAFKQFYAPRYSDKLESLPVFIDELLWYLAAYTELAMSGLFISALYYRMNKGLKLLVSIGVPVTLFVIFPLIERLYTGGRISRIIIVFFNYAWGYSNGYNPYYSFVSCIIFSIILGSLSFLLIRRASVKD